MQKKIILYYIFTPLSDPEVVMMWQKTLTDSLNLKGRIIISKDGINGTVGGDIKDVKAYIKANKRYLPFKEIRYKWSEGLENDFPKMSVKVRDEVVTFNAPEELKVDKKGVVGGGKKLKPEQVNELVKEKGDDVVFFDGRSAYEAKVGKFKNAVVPDVRTAKDFIPELESGKYDELKDKTVVTYCTGGIRCEILTSLMKNRGFKDVYQIDGGIVKYGEQYGDEGLWEGSLYVFDNRMGIKFSKDAKDIGECIHCNARTSNYVNCALKSCNDLVLTCEDCEKDPDNLYHSEACKKQALELDKLAA
jgi:UPF0176 protein